MKRLLSVFALLTVWMCSSAQQVDPQKGFIRTGYLGVGMESARNNPNPGATSFKYESSVLFQIGDSNTRKVGMIARVKHRDSVAYPRVEGMNVYDLSNDSIYWWTSGGWFTWASGTGGPPLSGNYVDSLWKSVNGDTIKYTINGRPNYILDKNTNEVTAVSVGGGAQVYREKTGNTLVFRTIATDGTMQVTQGADLLSFNVIPNTHIQRVQMLSNSALVATRKAFNLIDGGGVTITAVDNPGQDRVDYTITSTSGEVNTMSNLAGNGIGVFKNKVGVNFNMKKFVAGSNITLTDMADSIRIDASYEFIYSILSTISNGAPHTGDTLVFPITDSTLRIKSIMIDMMTKSHTDSMLRYTPDTVNWFLTKYDLKVFGDSIWNEFHPGDSIKINALTNLGTGDSLLVQVNDSTFGWKSLNIEYANSGLKRTVTGTMISFAVDSAQYLKVSHFNTYMDTFVVNNAINIYNSSGTLTGVGDRVVTLGTKNLTFDASAAGGLTINFPGADATGDIFYRNSSGYWTRLGIGAQGKVLKVDGGVPSWGDDATGGGSGVTSIGVGVPAGMTVSGTPVTTSGTINIGVAVAGIIYGTGGGLDTVKIASPLIFSNDTLKIQNATTVQTGALTATDWNTFNGKQNFIVTGTLTQYYRGDKTWQELITTVVTEGSNLYYTDARARLALSATSPITYNNSTGVIAINVANTSQNGYLTSTNWNTFNNKQTALQWKDEGSNTGTAGQPVNIDFTGAGVSASYSGGTLTVNVAGGAGGEVNTASNLAGTGVGLWKDKVSSDLRFKRIKGSGGISVADNTDSITISIAGVVTSVGLTMPAGFTVTGTPITSSGTLAVTTTLNGLIRGNGSGFNVVTIGAPITFDGTTLDILEADGSTTGALKSADWNTFNNKQDLIAAATTDHYYRGDKTMQILNTTVVPEGTNLYYTNARARLAISGLSPIIYNNSTGEVSIQVATNLQNGYLTSANWGTFNAKVNTASNIGTGVGIYKQKTATNLEMKSLTTNSTLTITGNTNDVSLVVNDNSSVQKIQVLKAGVSVGTRNKLNFIEGSGTTLTIADNSGADRIDVTVTSAAGGSTVNTTGATFVPIYRNTISNIAYIKELTSDGSIAISDDGDYITLGLTGTAPNIYNTNGSVTDSRRTVLFDTLEFGSLAKNFTINVANQGGDNGRRWFVFDGNSDVLLHSTYGTNPFVVYNTGLQFSDTSFEIRSNVHQILGASRTYYSRTRWESAKIINIIGSDRTTGSFLPGVYYRTITNNVDSNKAIFPFVAGVKDTILYYNPVSGQQERRLTSAGGGGGTVTSVALTVPTGLTVTGSPITGSGTLAISTTLNGIVRGTGTGFATTTISSPLGFTAGTLSISQANTTTAGYLSSVDWNTFNSKVGSGANIGTGAQVFSAKVGTALQFRTLVGDGITIVESGNEILFTVVGGGGGGTVTSVGLTMPSGFTVTGSPVTSSGTLGVSTTLNGLVRGTGSGFATTTVSAPLVFSAGTLSINQSNTTTDGYISSVDWNTFNNKVNTASNITGNGIGLFKQKVGTDLQFKRIKISGGTVTDNTDSVTITIPSQLQNLQQVTDVGNTTTAGILVGTAGNDSYFNGNRLGKGAGNGNNNVVFGLSAMNANTFALAEYNTAIGPGAMVASNNTNADFNTAVGYQALGNVANATNVGVGTRAGNGITSGVSNIAIGNQTLFTTTTGSYNIAVGMMSQSTQNQPGTSSGSHNISLGFYSMFHRNVNLTGTQNIVIGVNAFLQDVTSAGSNNIAIGSYAGKNGTYNNSIILGRNSGILRNGNSLFIVNTTNDTIADPAPFIDGDMLNDTIRFNTKVSIRDVDSLNTPTNMLWINAAGRVMKAAVPSGGGGGGTGTVTFVAMTMPTGFTVTGSPITTSGTLAVTTTLSGLIRGTGTGFATTTVSAPLSFSGSTLSIAAATTSVNGYLTSTDWNTFNGKLGTVSNLTGTGIGVFKAKVGTDAQLKRLVGGGIITITDMTDSILITASGGGGSGTVTSVALTVPSGFTVSGSPITTSGTITIGTTLNGLLYGTGSGFAAATVSAPLQFVAGTLAIQQSGASQNGYLSSTDWTTFNSKIGTANNGLTAVSGNVQLGGTLVANTTITNSTFLLQVSGTGTSVLQASSTTGNAVTGAASSSGIGVVATSVSGLAGKFTVAPSSTSTVVNALQIVRETSGTAADGMGGYLSFMLESSTGANQVSGNIGSIWTTAANASRTSKMVFETVNNGTTIGAMELAGNGKMTLNTYGDGVHTGLPAKMLAVENDGDVIEVDNNGVFAATASVTQAGTWGTASAFTSGTVINKVLKIGHLTNNSLRSMTVNAVFFNPTSATTTGTWITIATLPVDYRPNNSITQALPDAVDGGNYTNSSGTQLSGSCTYQGAKIRIQPNGNVDVFLFNISTSASLSGINTIIVPVHTTFFYIPGD